MDFEAFLSVELPGLSRFAGVLAGDRQGAHDLLTDTLVNLAPRWARISTMEFPLAYVRRALTMMYLTDRRRSDRRRTDPYAELAVFDRADQDSSALIGDRDQLRRLLSTLGPTQWAAVVMRYYLDLPDAEIAAALGCATSTVRSHLSRALAAMRVSATTATKE